MSDEDKKLIVVTDKGAVRGRRCLLMRDSTLQVYRYARIPFAKPPLGRLRFEPPQQPEAWQGVLDGSTRACQPMQPVEHFLFVDQSTVATNQFDEDLLRTSEDCLYLDVYSARPNEPSAKRPVMLWLYGGGFQTGSACKFDPTPLVALHDVVVVVPNYRLGAFGFFNLPSPSSKAETSPCPGNMGMLDQQMALQWTRANVARFGGDPSNVTLFGESVGSVSVSLHILASPHLFAKAICHSGVRDYPLHIQKDNFRARALFLEQLGLEGLEGEVLMEKLRAMPAEDIVQATVKGCSDLICFGVVENDGRFLRGNEFDDEQPRRHPCIFGINSTEGYGVFSPTAADNDEVKFSCGTTREAAFESVRKWTVQIIPPPHHEEWLREAFDDYASRLDQEDPFLWSKVSGSVFGDLLFVVPTVKMARRHAREDDVATYLYCMSQRLAYSHHPRSPASARKPAFCECDHGDDTVFTFGVPLLAAAASSTSNGERNRLTIDVGFSAGDEATSRSWMRYLANFAKTGNPNIGNDSAVTTTQNDTDSKAEWKPFTSDNEFFLNVCEQPRLEKRLMDDRVKFWTDKLHKAS